MVALILTLLWVALSVWVIGMILAAERDTPAPARVDPYARDVATFRAELADWDRRGRP